MFKLDVHSEEQKVEVNQKDDATARGAGNYNRAQCFRKGMAIQRSMLPKIGSRQERALLKCIARRIRWVPRANRRRISANCRDQGVGAKAEFDR